jgi:hypothetical protein
MPNSRSYRSETPHIIALCGVIYLKLKNKYMKRVIAVIVMLVMSYTVVGEVNIDGWPSRNHKGFNYKKHYKKQHRTVKLNKMFNRNNCYNHNIAR